MSEVGTLINSAVRFRDSTAQAEAWPLTRIYAVAWTIIFCVGAVDFLWLSCSRYSLAAGTFKDHMLVPIALSAVALAVRYILSRERYASLIGILHVREICAASEAIGLLTTFAYAAVILQNLCVTLSPPLIDEQLIAIDSALGFSWTAFADWHGHHQAHYHILSNVYVSFEWQVMFTAVILGFTKRLNDLNEFLLLFMVTSIVSILISAPIPASNPFIEYGMVGRYQESPWSEFFPLREGMVTVFDLDKSQGLVSMPSLHAGGAVLFSYAVRNLKFIFPISAALNTVMAYSAIVCGAHYLVDIIAGLALGGVTVAISRRLSWRRRNVDLLEMSCGPSELAESRSASEFGGRHRVNTNGV
jgi:membrane-associated phospholipid phosphatase